MPFTGDRVCCESFGLPVPFVAVHLERWQRMDRKFLVMINANRLPRLAPGELYSERLRAVVFFAAVGEIDLYGRGWAGAPLRVRRAAIPYTVQRLDRRLRSLWHERRPDPLLTAARRVYRGPVPVKRDVLGGYRFTLCLENTILPGYITEKLFHCFHAGTVPVYRGAPDIRRHVPAPALIDAREFPDYAELRTFLHGLDARANDRYRECAREFLASPAFHPFSTAAWVERLARIVAKDAREGA